MNVFQAQGYKGADEVRRWIEQDNPTLNPLINHQLVLTKNKDFNRDVIVEVHYFVASTPWAKNLRNAELCDRSSVTVLGNFPVRILEIHDNLIYLALHYAKHFLLHWQWVESNGNSRIKRLHELALLIEKHRPSINWDVLVDRCVTWKTCAPVAFVFQLIDHIYPGKISSQCVRVLREHIDDESAWFMDRALVKLLSIDPDTVLLGSNVINLYDAQAPDWPSGPQLSCPFSDSIGIYTEAGEFVIGAKNKGESDYAIGHVWWDNVSFNVQIHVENTSVHFGGEECLSGVHVMLFDPEAASPMRLISAFPFEKNGELQLRWSVSPSSEQLGKRPQDEQYSLTYAVRLWPSGYEMTLKIPWRILGFLATRGKKFKFDIAVNVSLGFAIGRQNRLKWSGMNEGPFEDPTLFGRLVLA